MNFEKKNAIYKSIMLVIITALVTFLLTSILMSNYYVKTDEGLERLLQTAEPTKLESKIQVIKKYLDEHFLGDTSNEDKLIESAIKGYVDGLGDIYTTYLSASDFNELMDDTYGNYVGIGVYMAQDKNGNVIILLPVEGSPAEKEGLQTGDIINKIDGESCKEMELENVASRIKGVDGTTVDLEIEREGKIINKTIKREKVQIYHIKTQVLEKNIGYIQILAFNKDCSKEFEQKLDELLQKGVKSLIIDLRYNGGGIVSEATDIADIFLPEGKTIMVQSDKNGNQEVTTSKANIKINSDLKVVLLVNDQTASASEILVAALKDNGVAKLVGINTYGKGVVQEIIPLSIGGALKLTIRETLTPNGDKINKVGIKPDVEIENNKETNKDEQLQKAIDMLK